MGIGAGEGSVPWLRVTQRHGARLQEQVTEEETVEGPVGEQHLLVAEALSGQSAQHRLDAAQRPKRRINRRSRWWPGSDKRESMRMRPGVAAHPMRHARQVGAPPVN